MTALYRRLSINSDVAVASIDDAMLLLGNPEGRISLHVSPEFLATEGPYIQKLLAAWGEDGRLARNPLAVVGDQDLDGREWFIERRGRRAGSGGA